MSAAEPLLVDPFANTADPARYVARPATERALQALRAALASGPCAAALTGPTGIGKTLVARVLARRLEPSHTVACIPVTPSGVEQVCESALHALGETPAGEAVGALARHAAELASRGRPLLLVLDCAEGLPRSSLAQLGGLVRAGLRLLLVASEREDLDADLAALGPGLARVRLDTPLSRSETEQYLRARLDAGSASPELRSRVLGLSLELWRRSRGNPLCLHAEVSQVQLDLWRATAAEPRLRVVPETAPVEPDPVLGDLEVGAALEPVAESSPAIPDSEPAPAAPAPEPEVFPAPAPPEPARRPRSVRAFAAGAASGALAASALWMLVPPRHEPLPAAPPPAAPSPRPIAVPPPDPPPEPEPLARAPEVPADPPAQPPPEAAPPPAAARPAEGARPAPAGPVRVQVQAVPWATIYVDGRLVGETPLGDLRVEPGLREFRAEMSDGRTLVRQVRVRAGTRVVFP